MATASPSTLRVRSAGRASLALTPQHQSGLSLLERCAEMSEGFTLRPIARAEVENAGNADFLCALSDPALRYLCDRRRQGLALTPPGRVRRIGSPGSTRPWSHRTQGAAAGRM